MSEIVSSNLYFVDLQRNYQRKTLFPDKKVIAVKLIK